MLNENILCQDFSKTTKQIGENKMSYCKYCGKEIAVGEEHKCDKNPAFGKFVSWLFDKSGVENPFQNKNEVYERNMLITPDCIDLEEGEIPVKQYKVGILRSRMRFQRSEGRLQITNKRVLFRAAGYSPSGATIYQHAFAIDKIDGIEIRKDRRFRVPDFLFALLWYGLSYAFFALGFLMITSGVGMGIFGKILMSTIVVAFGIGTIAFFFWKRKRFFLKLLLTGIAKGGILSIIIAIFESSDMNTFLEIISIPSLVIWGLIYLVLTVLFCVSGFLFVVKPNLMIEIKTSSGSPGIQLKHKEISFVWHKSEEFSGFTEILPWEETDLVIKEIATVIDDIKTLGDFGVDKWRNITN